MLVVLAAPRVAEANLRGPHRVRTAPSSAVRGREENLLVLRETLSFACGGDECRVVAHYSVHAPEPVQTDLQFILPEQPAGNAVRARMGGKTLVAAVETTTLDPEEKKQILDVEYRVPLFRARFDAAFRPGTNEIEVEYVQPLGIDEVDYGYFHKGTFVKRWDYEVWPLKEWKRAPGFAIEVTVSVPRKPPTRWQRWFGTIESIACEGDGHGHSGNLAGSLRQIATDRLEYRARIAAAIPDHLRCAWGDEKHLWIH
jgi:hypothetical protein